MQKPIGPVKLGFRETLPSVDHCPGFVGSPRWIGIFSRGSLIHLVCNYLATEAYYKIKVWA